MPSKVSWFNIEIMKQIARSTGWISIVYFLGLLLILPIQLLMMYSEERLPQDYNEYLTLFQVNFEFQLGLLVIVPVVLTVFLFRFLHVKQASDMMHSLPLNREKIFHHYALAGMVFLIAPVAVNTLILLFMHTALDLDSVFHLKDLVYWAGTTVVIAILLYTVSVMIAMLTGISAVNAVLAYIFLFFPVGFTLLLFYNLKILLYGFPSDLLLNQQLEKLSPITYAANRNGSIFHWRDTFLYLILALVFYWLALYLYRKRNVEQASEAIAFPKLRAIFKYGVTFCVMLVGGTYFNGVSNNSLSWIIFGYVIGAFFGYFIAEMVLQKTWRVFAQVKGLAIYAAIIAVLVIGVKTLGIYENKVPDIADIQSVQLANDRSFYMINNVQDDEFIRMKPMKDQANITAVRRLHQQILADRQLKQHKNENLVNYFIQYKLKNGRTVNREYQVNQRLYDDFFKPIYDSKDYKFAVMPIFKVPEEKIKTVNIRANGPLNKQVTLSDPEEIKEALSTLRADILAESYEDSLYFQDRGSTVEFLLNNKHYVEPVDFKPIYRNLSHWLKKKELLDRAAVTADDFSHVLVVKSDTTNHDVSENALKQELEGKENSVDIKNKRQIGELLNRVSASTEKEYKVIFYYKFGGYYEIMSFDEEHAPDFVLKHF